MKPSILHGDLWSGNISAVKGDDVAIFDPAGMIQLNNLSKHACQVAVLKQKGKADMFLYLLAV